MLLGRREFSLRSLITLCLAALPSWAQNISYSSVSTILGIRIYYHDGTVVDIDPATQNIEFAVRSAKRANVAFVSVWNGPEPKDRILNPGFTDGGQQIVWFDPNHMVWGVGDSPNQAPHPALIFTGPQKVDKEAWIRLNDFVFNEDKTWPPLPV